MKSKIPFLTRLRYFSVENESVVDRLTGHLLRLRASNGDQIDIDLSSKDEAKIRRRAKLIWDIREGYVSSRTLKREDRERLKSASTGVTLRGPATEHEVDLIGAALHDEMPWMRPVTEKIWLDMRSHLQSGGVGVKFSPTLIVGPPGIGKSHLARRLGELSKSPSMAIDVSATTEGFSVVGSQRTWGSSTPGRPVQAILETGVGNPIVVIDEICKARIVTSSNGANTSVLHGLLGLLEPVSARNWDCPYHQTSFDMSHVNWILTANLNDRLPDALRSRMRIVSVPPLTTDHLVQFAEKEVLKRGLSNEIVEDILRLLSAYPDQHPLRNLRTVTKHLNDIEALCKMPILV
ncbi:AAA family ATPase [Sulfitobacter sp. R86518]|uniref:AAA family ATPase n=1 Tax=Sulfitobacter sp. R86518 TaxID=3093858 RepID=UPI0036DDAF7A